ncbi:MAG TPA: class I SAM-dependent methyltransferase [Bacteroidales bacterium]|nr:class I SAM-dependent methyltransferase [Bacteroidales bacterium]HQJ37226.1 class I SAM-dependent methyltransferase [Bacillota bacterium]HQL34967.1 class I SAM-dependent methyltransferase [Bacillota bacterium]HRS21647.1 class I SAM-dependent methyltransferase [Clostridia bacterium]
MKDFAQKSRENYNLIAEDYDNSLEGRYTEKFKELLLDEILIDVNENILDVACGNASLLKMISNKCDIKGYGIDISEKMIECAGRKCPDMTFQVSGCEDTSFYNQTFDVITVCAAYHHFPDVKAFAKEAYRILKTHGRLYIAEVYYPFIVRLLLNPFVPMSKAGDVKFYSPKEIKSNFEAHGFKQSRCKIEGNIQIIEMLKV